MFGIFINYILVFIFAVTTMFFGILTYYHKKYVFFSLGLISAAIGLLICLLNLDYFIYGFQNGAIMFLAPLAAWVGGIVFLILSKNSQKNQNEDITDDFLNDIINAEEEDWDPES